MIFSCLRLGVLIALLFLTHHWLHEGGGFDKARLLWIIVLSFAICFRFFRSEFRNGQINVLLVASCIGGIFLALHTSRGKQMLGGALIALAASIKITPLLFIGPLLLRGRWRAFVSAIVTLAVLQAILWVWLGSETNCHLWTQWRSVAEQMVIEAATNDRAASVPDLP